MDNAGICGEETWRSGRAVGVEGTEESGVVPSKPAEIRFLVFRLGCIRLVLAANLAW